MTNLRTQITRLAKELEEEDNIASDLWTWLPSYKTDYATRPTNAEIMAEACDYLAELKGK